MTRAILFALLMALQSVALVTSAYAAKASKEQQQVCKTLKKTLNAKTVEPFGNAPEAPLYRFCLKESLYGIVDRSGKIILQPEYDKVLYFPAFDGYTVQVDGNNKKSTTISLPTVPTSEALWGFANGKDAALFDVDGNLIKTFPNTSAEYFGNYLYLTSAPYSFVYEGTIDTDNSSVPCISMISLYRDKGYGHGNLVRADGTIVIPDVDQACFYENNPYVVYTRKTDNKVALHGMKVVDNRVHDRAPAYQDYLSSDNKWVQIGPDKKFIGEIPPEFYHLICRNGVWEVADKPSEKYGTTAYDPATSRALIIRDPGEAFFVRGEYDDVLAYYADDTLDAPWASYYSAQALYNKCSFSQSRFERIVEAMENGSGLPANEQGVISDVNVLGEMLRTSHNLFDQYLASGDEEFRDKAQTYSNITQDKINNLNSYISRYNNVRSHAAMVTSQAEAQQAAYMSAILNSFTNALKSSSSSNKTNRGASSAGTASIAVSSSGSSSSGTDNSGRKAFLKGQIADWRNKLKKAERAYEEAMGSGDDSWQKKRVLESKQKTIDECANMIRQYESELNSLK